MTAVKDLSIICHHLNGMAKIVASSHPFVLVHDIQCFWRAAVNDSPRFGTCGGYDVSISGTVRSPFFKCQAVIRYPTSAHFPDSSSSEFLPLDVQVAAICELPDVVQAVSRFARFREAPRDYWPTAVVAFFASEFVTICPKMRSNPSSTVRCEPLGQKHKYLVASSLRTV